MLTVAPSAGGVVWVEVGSDVGGGVVAGGVVGAAVVLAADRSTRHVTCARLARRRLVNHRSRWR